MKIPVTFPIIRDEDKQAVIKAVEKGWFTEGTQCAKFDKALRTLANQNYAQLVNSGSSANLVALTSACEIWTKGKLVLTSALAFPTTVAPIYQNNKIPVYVDTDPKTLSPDIGQIAYLVDKYRDEICGGIFSHTLGFPYDERLVQRILNGKFLIADCCDALGAKVHDFSVGTFANISTYSFFPAHHITTGEGGAVLTNSDALFKIMRSVSNWGRDCHCQPGQSGVCGKRFEHEWDTLPKGYDHKYTFTRLGYNLKMTELQAAMGVTQMKNVSNWCSLRTDNFARLRNNLNKFKEYIQFLNLPSWSHISPFGFPIILKTPGLVSDLISYLEKKGISTRRIFAGNITCQPGYANLPYVNLDLENTNYLMENAFWIGCHPGITSEMIDYISDAFEQWFNGRELY